MAFYEKYLSTKFIFNVVLTSQYIIKLMKHAQNDRLPVHPQYDQAYIPSDCPAYQTVFHPLVGSRNASLHQAPVLTIVGSILSDLSTLSLVVGTSPGIGTRNNDSSYITSGDGAGKVLSSGPALVGEGRDSESVVVADRQYPEVGVVPLAVNGGADTCFGGEGSARGVSTCLITD